MSASNGANLSPPNEEDCWRANTYRLLARLLAAPPDGDLLARLGELPEPEARAQALALAWGALGEAARQAGPQSLAEEYQALFIGPTRGELVPYGSWYLRGFLMEKPLALLRAELAELGIERQQSSREPEDHVAAVCESMSLLIEAGDLRQAGFFASHLAPWLGRFFRDLRTAEAADFYRALGALGDAFLEVERVYLEMPPVDR